MGRSLGVPKGVFSFAKENTPFDSLPCGAFHVSDASNVSTVAADIRSAVQGKQWMCGFPERLVILTSGQYVVSVYGNESLVNTFRDKFVAAHSGASTVYDEAIGA